MSFSPVGMVPETPEYLPPHSFGRLSPLGEEHRPRAFASGSAEYVEGGGSLPVSERLSRTVLRLPMHPYLSDSEID